MARRLVALVAVAVAIPALLVLALLASAPVSSLLATLAVLTAPTMLAALAVLAALLAGPVVTLSTGLQVLFAVDAATAVPTAHVFVLAELARVGPSLFALLMLLLLALLVVSLLALLMVALLVLVVLTLLALLVTLLSAVTAALLALLTSLVDVTPGILMLDGLTDSGLAAAAGLLVVLATLTVLIAVAVLTALTVLAAVTVLAALAVLAGLLDGLLVLGVTVAHVLVGVRVVVLTRPLRFGSPGSVPATRGMSAVLSVVAHLLVLVLLVTSTASPSALIVLCHVRVPIGLFSGFSIYVLGGG